MSQINILSPLLANQIAAGEVVDRPSSVVKECIENSIDSGADVIKITIKNFGKEVIIVEDNGTGIPKSELSKTILRHATSKVSELKDLSSIITFGFRGEALASISSVSRFRISSCLKGQAHGWCVKVDGHESNGSSFEADPIKSGTKVEIRDLFYNTPARRRFLKSDRSEWFAIDDVIKRAALANPSITFKILKNDSKPKVIDATTDLIHRCKEVLSNEFASNAIAINNIYENISIEGIIALPTFSRSQGDMQYIFLNHRPIKDKNISASVKRAYQDVMYQQRFPAYVINFKIDPYDIDVNVHPSKEWVKFANHSLVCQSIYKTIKDALADHRPQHQVNNEFRGSDNNAWPTFQQSRINNSVKPSISSQSLIDTMILRTKDSVSQSSDQIEIPMNLNSSFQKSAMDSGFQKESKKHLNYQEKKYDENIKTEVNQFPLGFAIGQVNGVFIISTNQSGLVVVDMHAAHERILYEKLKYSYSKEGIVSQKVLIPISLDVDEHQIKCVKEYTTVINNLGFGIEINGNALNIRSTPQLLGHLASSEVVENVIADLMSPAIGNAIQARLNTLFSTMACHSAIRANRSLSHSEMNDLLRQIEQTPNSGQCNHGRPTWIQFSHQKMDSWFNRGH